jgi:hypothetical protein
MAAKKATKRDSRSRRGAPSKALRVSTSNRRTTPHSNAGAPLPFEGLVAAYVEFPGRLLACRTPLQVWSAYFQFGQRVASAMTRATR